MFKLCSSCLLLKYLIFVLPDMSEPLTSLITPLGSFTLFYQWFAFFKAQEHKYSVGNNTRRFGGKYPMDIPVSSVKDRVP